MDVNGVGKAAEDVALPVNLCTVENVVNTIVGKRSSNSTMDKAHWLQLPLMNIARHGKTTAPPSLTMHGRSALLQLTAELDVRWPVSLTDGLPSSLAVLSLSQLSFRQLAAPKSTAQHASLVPS
eukprot:3615666-Amphidinium_carterae.1